MANIMCLFSSSNTPISPEIYPKIINPNLTIAPTSMSTNNKWSISEDLTLISTPSKHNYLSGLPNFTDEFSMKREQELKEIRGVLREVGEDSSQVLVMIDALQRLGIDYHFLEEIGVALDSQYTKYSNPSYFGDELYEVSTRFRLLRQEGYSVPTDMFDKFMDKEGKFKSELSKDIRGLIGLHEASHLSMEGEEILDHAGEFSAQLLNIWMTNLDNHQARIVANTLCYPYHKSLAKFRAKNFLSDHKGQNGLGNVLQGLAEMEFSLEHSIHKQEILQISRWWKGTGLAKELKFARDQPLKWYMWPMAALTHPSLSEERVDLTKPISLIYIIDDIFDVHGSVEELTLFTEAVNGWDQDAIDSLPEYMKITFKALDNTTSEISYKVYKKHGWNPIDSLRRTWADLCNAFLVEAKWFASGQLPKAEEYLQNGIISSGVHVALVHMFFLLGHGFNNDSINLVTYNPSIITSTATILRLCDDLGSAKDENQDGHDGSYVECYVNETGYSVESARKRVINMISETWKCLNQNCLAPNPFSTTFIKGCLNMARMIPLMYGYDENSRLPVLEKHMKSIINDRITL